MGNKSIGMSKRPGFLVTILFFVFALVGFYIYLKRQQSPLIQPIHGVPVDAAVIIEINKPFNFLTSLNNNTQILSDTKELDFASSLFAQLAIADSLVQNTQLKAFIENKSVLLSLHDVGNNEINGLLVSKLSGKFEANQLFRFFEETLIGAENITSTRYNQVRINNANVDNTRYYYAFNRGVFLASKSELLLKNAIRQLDADAGLHNSEELSNLIKTAGDNSLANIYLKSPEFKTILNSVFSKDYLKATNITSFGSWSLLDMNLKKNVLLFNGFTSGINAENFQHLLQGQKPTSFKFTKFAPVGIQSYLAFGISNYHKYKDNLKEFMQENNQLDRHVVNQKSFRDDFGENAENRLAEIFNGELVQMRLLNNESLFYIKNKVLRTFYEKVLISLEF